MRARDSSSDSRHDSKFADDDADAAPTTTPTQRRKSQRNRPVATLTAAATRPDCEHTRCVLYGDVSWRELLQKIATTIAVHQLHLDLSQRRIGGGQPDAHVDSSATEIDATITYDIDSKAAMLDQRVAARGPA